MNIIVVIIDIQKATKEIIKILAENNIRIKDLDEIFENIKSEIGVKFIKDITQEK